MRIKIDFYVNESRKLRSSLSEAITAYIYRCIRIADPKYATTMHEEGIRQSGCKKFMYHSYAIYQGTTLLKKELPKGTVSLVFTSAIDDTVIKFVQGMMEIGQVQIFGRGYDIEGIEHITEYKNYKSGMFRIISPVYSEEPGRKWVDKKGMETKLEDNLTGKYYALKNKLPERDIRIRLLNASYEYMYYKKDVFRGIVGSVIIDADKDVIDLAYYAGLGTKCGLGLGLISVI